MTTKSFALTFAALAVVCSFFSLTGPSAASAATPAPRLVVHALSVPSHFSQADNELCLSKDGKSFDGSTEIHPCDGFWVTVTNLGGAPARGPIKITDELPADVTVPPGLSSNVENVNYFWFESKINHHKPFETSSGQPLSTQELCSLEARAMTCEFPETTGELLPGQRLEFYVYTTLDPGAGSAVNAVSVTEAGVPVASTTDPMTVDPTAPPFGITDVQAPVAGVDGLPYTQAGGHPYSFSTRIDFNTEMGINQEAGEVKPAVGVGNPRSIAVDLPIGFLGTAQDTPKCTFAELVSYPESCPNDTIVGHIASQPTGSRVVVNSTIYNMVPEKGVAAEFGLHDLLYTPHVITAGVAPTPHGYVLRAVAKEIPELDASVITTTFYGDPAAAQKELEEREGETPGLIAPAAAFTNPSDCSGGPLVTTVFADSWQNPGAVNPDGTPDVEGAGWASASSPESESAPVTGCNALHFSASMSAKPDTTAADSPTGMTLDLAVPQSEAPGTLATPPLKDATVAFPAGLTLNPAAASGLQACSEEQVGWVGWGGPGSPGEAGKSFPDFTEAAPACPEASRVGAVEVTSPLLEKPVVGSLYLATQDTNPYGALLAGYLVIDDPLTGTILKIPGELKMNPATGQITAIFDENPQLPFSELKVRAYAGKLATPQSCGTFTTTSDLMPWSAPESGPDATPSDSFAIGSNCALGLNPSFSAGTMNNQAGAFSPLTLTIARQDGEQHLTGLAATMPPGVLGSLKGIPLCGEAQANAGTCAAASQVGEVSVSAGVGPEPYVVHGGKVFLTGPYNGGPFGLSVVIPAVAGPFNLGNVVVRNSIRIDPVTSQITVVSDPFPTMVNSVEGLKSGIPADIREVNVTIDRPNFTFNATSCSPSAVTGTLSGANGATVPVSSHYQAASCAGLPFKPSLSASVAGRASKADGAALTVKVVYPNGPQGSYANVKSVKVDLPVQLPSRLSTLQRACTAATFAANPANCPPESDVGTATAKTPVLNVPLTGPAYLVSHANEAFPSLEIVLQGEGVEIVLTGATDIKKGITSSTFKMVPDAPVSSFELMLPAKQFSILGANVPEAAHYNLCGQTLNMPTAITGQNGAVIKPATKIAVTGCAKAKTLTRAQKLQKALKVCRKKAKGKRAACEAKARQSYGAVKKSKKRAKK